MSCNYRKLWWTTTVRDEFVLFTIIFGQCFINSGQILSNYWTWKHQTNLATLAKILVLSGTCNSSSFVLETWNETGSQWARSLSFHWSVFYPVECVSVALSCSPQSESVRRSEHEWSRVSIEWVLREAGEVKGFSWRPNQLLVWCCVCVCVCQEEMFYMYVSRGTCLTWTVFKLWF